MEASVYVLYYIIIITVYLISLAMFSMACGVFVFFKLVRLQGAEEVEQPRNQDYIDT